MNNVASSSIHSAERSFAASIAPGVLLCTGVMGIVTVLQHLEVAWLSRAWLESLVLAIVAGTIIRTFWSPGERWQAGIKFSSKTLLPTPDLTRAQLIGDEVYAGIANSPECPPRPACFAL